MTKKHILARLLSILCGSPLGFPPDYYKKAYEMNQHDIRRLIDDLKEEVKDDPSPCYAQLEVQKDD